MRQALIPLRKLRSEELFGGEPLAAPWISGGGRTPQNMATIGLFFSRIKHFD
jgi:hypothetical protein